MGHHGWGGDPPRTEDDARERIRAAAIACLDRFGPTKTSLSDVAAELGVTRQTVYRYYPGLAEILSAVAEAGVADFVARMEAHLAGCTTPAEAAVESVVFSVRAIPDEPHIGLLFRAGENEFFSRGVTSAMAVELGADILRRVPVDWAAAGVVGADFEGLAEVLMRLFVSLLQFPVTPPRSDDDIRALVTRWVAPALG